jgi:hypothetical protein
MTRNQEIAQTILQQFGGRNRLSAMTGAKNFVAIENGLQFSIGRNAGGINIVIIKLRGDDTYDVEFGAARRVKLEMRYTIKDRTEGAYADMLKPLFEKATGMYLTL